MIRPPSIGMQTRPPADRAERIVAHNAVRPSALQIQAIQSLWGTGDFDTRDIASLLWLPESVVLRVVATRGGEA